MDSHHSSPKVVRPPSKMRRDDQRFEQQGHRQCAERSLHADDDEKQSDGHQRLAAVLAESHTPRRATPAMIGTKVLAKYRWIISCNALAN